MFSGVLARTTSNRTDRPAELTARRQIKGESGNLPRARRNKG